MQKWLSIVGIGEDGLSGVSPIARALIDHAEVLVGGARHLAMLPPDDRREKLPWTSPIVPSDYPAQSYSVRYAPAPPVRHSW